MQKTNNIFRYPLAYNFILDYWEQIRDNKVVVSKKVYKFYE